MGVGDFVRSGVGQMRVARPAEGRRHLSYAYRLGAPPVFSQLEVAGGEAAVFRAHGTILGALGPGRHSLSPTATPFLERSKSTDGQRYECDVIFVTTGPTRLSLDGTVGPLTDAAGREAEFFLLGSATVGTHDPVRVVSQGIGVGEPGAAFDRIVLRRLMQGLAQRLPEVLEGGLADPTSPATLGPALQQAGREDGLGVGVLGLDVHAVEVSRLASRQNQPPAGREAAARRAETEAAEALPAHVSCHFGATRIPFWDTRFEMAAHVSVVGHFEGDKVPSPQEPWLKDAILQTLRQAATTWTGTVLDLPGKRDEWARYVTQVVAPHLRHHTGLRGHVVIDGVEIDAGEEAELKRRRAAELARG
jgi:hypothetical protein